MYTLCNNLMGIPNYYYLISLWYQNVNEAKEQQAKKKTKTVTTRFFLNIIANV